MSLFNFTKRSRRSAALLTITGILSIAALLLCFPACKDGSGGGGSGEDFTVWWVEPTEDLSEVRHTEGATLDWSSETGDFPGKMLEFNDAHKITGGPIGDISEYSSIILWADVYKSGGTNSTYMLEGMYSRAEPDSENKYITGSSGDKFGWRGWAQFTILKEGESDFKNQMCRGDNIGDGTSTAVSSGGWSAGNVKSGKPGRIVVSGAYKQTDRAEAKAAVSARLYKLEFRK